MASQGSAALSALERIARKSLKERVVDHIYTAITTGELPAGEQVTELGLAKRLGVSQPTIREALIELEHRGFIQRQSPRKTFVTVLSKRDIDEAYLVRMRLEVLAAELVTAADSPNLAECEAAFERMLRAAKQGDMQEFNRADLEFHRGLWRAAGNRTLTGMLEQLVPRLFAFVLIQRAAPDRQALLKTADGHRKLLDAIGVRDRARACRMMEDSLRQAHAEDLELSE